ncbi:MAG: signal recognition particle-docking protein FtsY [Candidatus Micrarchaeota archaeon]
MFGLLKKKISSFISSIVEKEEKPAEQEGQAREAPEAHPEKKEPSFEPEPQQPEPEQEPTTSPKLPEPIRGEPKQTEPVFEKPKPEPKPEPIHEKPKPVHERPKLEEKKRGPVESPKPAPKTEKPALKKEQTKPEPVLEKPKRAEKPKPTIEQVFEKPERILEESKPTPESSTPSPIAFEPRERKEEEERKLEVRLSLGSRLRSFISNEIEIKEGDVSELLDGLNMALLESDVAYEVADHIVTELRSKLIGMKVPKGSVDTSIKSAVRSSLLEVLSTQGINFLKTVRDKPKPVKILLLGPNGAGKTTTMGKLSTLLKEAGFTSVFSASDTFRAAAIEQAEKHGEKLGVRVIKHEYGADPTAVAFDAVNYARAHKIDAVLIDSAGRQETNRNLIDEMKKLNRVIQPDLKIFIGESIAGNALVSQVKSFSDAVGLDGVILTKLDCDAKGGTALSLAKATGVPILYFGVGQTYTDLIPFSAEFVVDQVMGG